MGYSLRIKTALRVVDLRYKALRAGDKARADRMGLFLDAHYRAAQINIMKSKAIGRRWNADFIRLKRMRSYYISRIKR